MVCVGALTMTLSGAEHPLLTRALAALTPEARWGGF